MHVLLRLLVNAAALWVATRLVPGISYTGDGVSLFGVALVFGVLNVLIKPILFLLSLPFIIVTLGLFYFLINVLMLYVTDWVVPDFEIRTFWWGALAAIIVSIVNGLLHPLLPDPRERRRAPQRA